ncbi:ABC transporter permease [Rhodocytophaga aerolata]|uniref:ABC transporter permease n=1 Tax=Rhodocytophaga aerolata TaxID=455078 RepID=A0ABT8R521_9BACT|nr:ABC transporter permease [Rhodocytophaga aerolata]MDO1447197.1 ABC transporter permease [Rhodocytophaga aerolata]
MLRNYLIITWRNLLKNKLFSAVNITGLAIGMAACLLILQYVSFELGYDSFHKQADHIYRIESEHFQEGIVTQKRGTGVIEIGDELKKTFPQVQEVVRVSTWTGVVTAPSTEGILTAYNEDQVLFVDASFLRTFSFPLVNGSPDVLDEPHAVIITQSAALKYFGKQDPIGREIIMENHNQGHKLSGIVRGICQDAPLQSHLQFNFLVSRNTPGQAGGPKTWDAFTYLLVSPGTNTQPLQDKLASFIKTHQDGGTSSINYFLQPLSAIHLYAGLAEDISRQGDSRIVWFLVCIAVLVLFIAYINYINLSTAKALERAKEVGIRKVMGSMRIHLMKQFFLESLLLNLLGLIFALTIVQFTLPWFKELVGIAIPFTLWQQYPFIPILLLFTFIGALLSGFYPALILSAYQPMQVLKGQLYKTGKGLRLRKVLVFFQFAASLVLTIGTFAVYRQVSYMHAKDLGMNIEQTLIVAAPQSRRDSPEEESKFLRKLANFQTQVRTYAGISSFTTSSTIPGKEVSWYNRIIRRPDAPDEEVVRYHTLAIGPEFIDQFGIKLIAGEKFSVNSVKSENSIIPIMINAAALAPLGFVTPAQAIGQNIYSRNGRGRTFKLEIIGVLQDFHNRSLKEKHEPMIFYSQDGSSIEYFAAKVNPENIKQTVQQLETTFKNTFPSSPFEYFFLDEFFNRQYQQDEQFEKVFSFFSSLAVLVACMGLFGLSLLTTRQRTKEIGVRKVLGASVYSILSLLTSDFIKLILLANVFAWPVAYWGISRWLENYAFRIEISAFLFILPTLLILVTALVTVSIQTMKAARANPAKALNYE